MENGETAKLSPEQIENWRRVLCMMVGPYALIMSKEEIQHYRDRIQTEIDNLKKKRNFELNKDMSKMKILGFMLDNVPLWILLLIIGLLIFGC